MNFSDIFSAVMKGEINKDKINDAVNEKIIMGSEAALIHAGQLPQKDDVKKLIQEGADEHAKNADKKSEENVYNQAPSDHAALIRAEQPVQEDDVKKLIQEGADEHAKREDAKKLIQEGAESEGATPTTISTLTDHASKVSQESDVPFVTRSTGHDK